MAQVRCEVIVNLLPSSGDERVVDMCDELALLLEAQAGEMGLVVKSSYQIATDDEFVQRDEVAVVQGNVESDASEALLLAEAVGLGSAR